MNDLTEVSSAPARGTGEMEDARCPTRGCVSKRFWRLVDAHGRPLYPEASPICAECHPPQPGAAHAVELLEIGTDAGRAPALGAGSPGSTPGVPTHT